MYCDNVEVGSVSRTVHVLATPTLALVGNAEVSIYKDSEYNDAGATIVGDTLGLYNVEETTNTVDTTTVGDYEVEYTLYCNNVEVGSVSRIVHVIEEPIVDEPHVHNLIEVVEVLPTCTQDGNIGYWRCDGCNKYFSDGEGVNEIELNTTVLNRLGHTFGDWSIIREATYDLAGFKKRTCQVCGAKETEEIEKLVRKPKGGSGGGSSSSSSNKKDDDKVKEQDNTENLPGEEGNQENSAEIDTNSSTGSGATNFEDVKKDSWFYESVDYVVKRGLFKGKTEKEFGPKENLTRGMLITVIYNLEGATETEISEFEDVKAEAYYSSPIAWAYKNNIAKGVGDNKFSPMANITRQDFITIVYNYMQYMHKNKITNQGTELTGYIDTEDIRDYAEEAFKWAVANKIISGRTNATLAPRGLATRAEAAEIMKKLDQLVSKK